MIEFITSDHMPTKSRPADTTLIEPAEIAAVEPRIHRVNHFGPNRPHVVVHLKSGKSINVFESADQVKSKVLGAKPLGAVERTTL
jgi:hypothetical protein